MKIAYISTYPPRECGLATFNQNLIKAINANLSEESVQSTIVIALNSTDNANEYAYPDEVKQVIRQNIKEDYTAAAEFINNSEADVCVLQHEFGIYGGEEGLYVLPFINQIEKPLISILHTVLKEPSFLQRSIIREIANRSSKIVVMSRKAIQFLVNIYQIPREKIQFIEHGVPDFEAKEPKETRKKMGLEGKRILLTFGLINRNKGLETVVKALPLIVAQHPETVYVILGNTHPGVLKQSGEEYRDYLKQLAQELGVADHLVFMNRFVEEDELVNYLAAADLYITPYLNEAQITSGTLSYAVGAGAAVLSTPYWHAQELLSNDRGYLFNFKDHKSLALIVNELLSDQEELQSFKTRAYEYGLHLRWPKIGQSYIDVINKAVKHPDYSDKILRQIIDPGLMPKFSLEYVMHLTDDTGIFQHAKFGIPNRKEGYCLDDNSRALLMALMAYQETGSQEALNLMPVYLSYIHDMQLENGDFRNFLSFSREYLDEHGSEDSFGRTIWALGYLIHAAPNRSFVEFGREVLFNAIPHFKKLEHLRGIVNVLIGLSYYLKVHPYDETVRAELDLLTKKLITAYKINKTEGWNWFEEQMTYDNALFPLALFHVAEITEDSEAKRIALESMEHIEKVTCHGNIINPVGNNGWYSKNDQKMPLYDQQAIELMAMVLMYSQAYVVTKESSYIKKMFSCYMWFMGENSLRIPLYDNETKGCADGLHDAGINRNQGAESTLAYLIAHLVVLHALKFDYEPHPDQRKKVLLLR
ncbi:glycosyltransferase family 4 protein [Pedobacter montanisoli]|uniref:Glycosyltransferase family 4 protein n=1 Tax=Pedobacter montanisoli TaxID=2923277 RepID=A0ABS9ZYM7_9SPHI|nr:glycosyltransferase family 4 protein [Pedobacter montanisoli]MCJ0743400.1 glycosyltransferase family 4 protein [Pedobacter montanisoli]